MAKAKKKKKPYKYKGLPMPKDSKPNRKTKRVEAYTFGEALRSKNWP